MANNTKFQKDGPKRRRYTRRELPYGQLRLWGSTVGNFASEREARLRSADLHEMQYATASPYLRNPAVPLPKEAS
jgi:hypothetical protein